MINVLVTGAGGGVGQGIIKSLKMIDDLDINIVAADMSELSSGLYAGDVACLVQRCTSPDYFKSLENIFKKHHIDYYFPGTDVELAFCSQNKKNILRETGVYTVISSEEVINIADDKYKTYEFLKHNSFLHPKTFYLNKFSSELLEFPVIVKPAVGCRSIGVYKVSNIDELQAHKEKPEGIVVQECVGSEDTEYTCTIVKSNGKLSPVLALKRTLRAGDTFRAEPVKSKVIEGYVSEVASKLDIDGGCNFQLRLDSCGQPKIFEINSRFSGTTPFCAQLGFNPVEFFLKNQLGMAYQAKVDYDSVVLRYWSEVVIKKSQLETLSADSEVKPALKSQLQLFTDNDDT